MAASSDKNDIVKNKMAANTNSTDNDIEENKMATTSVPDDDATQNKMAASSSNDDVSQLNDKPGEYNCDNASNAAIDNDVDMEVVQQEEEEHENRVGINDLPDEILEYIIKLVSPYQDFRSCSR